MAFTICVLLSMWLPMVSATREMKPKDAVKLCGQDFIKAWTTICKLKQMKRARGRKRRSLDGKFGYLLFYGQFDAFATK